MEHLGRIITSLFGGFIVLVSLIFILQGSFFEQTGGVVTSEINELNNPSPSTEYYIGYYNLEDELSKNPIIQALPSNSILLLKFYNFDSGERTWEKAYIFQRGEVKETTNLDEKADVILTLHSKYLQELTNKNFCEIIKKSNQNGDLEFYTKLSWFSLTWKFKSIYRYRDCFGI